MDKKYTPEEIKKLRKKLGITQQELSNKLAVAKNTVACWEIGVRNPSAQSQILMDILLNNYKK
jgi:DNA-binding transcriptional regulator YiaG